MLKNGIWRYMMGSFFLHVLMLILLARAVTVSQVDMPAMETFLIVPSAVSMRGTGQPMHPVVTVTTGRRGPEVARSLSGQNHKVPASATVNDMPSANSRKRALPAFALTSTAPGSAETGTMTTAAPAALATSRFLREGTTSQSATTFPQDTEGMAEMSLGDAGAPRFIHREEPVYPFLARKLGKEGNVVLRLTLDERGGQKDIEIIVKAGFGFTEAAIQALKKSILSPAQKDGKPVVSRVVIPVTFVLREN